MGFVEIGALQAHCRPRMHPLYMCREDFNMDDSSEFLKLTYAVVGVNFLQHPVKTIVNS